MDCSLLTTVSRSPQHLRPKLETLNPKPQTLNPKYETLKPKPDAGESGTMRGGTNARITSGGKSFRRCCLSSCICDYMVHVMQGPEPDCLPRNSVGLTSPFVLLFWSHAVEYDPFTRSQLATRN